MISKLTSILNRILFVGCFLMAGLALWERLLNLFGFTVLGGAYAPSRMLAFSGVGVLFVIALQLQELKEIERTGRGGGSP
jgi:preprotein translocase subunit SecY